MKSISVVEIFCAVIFQYQFQFSTQIQCFLKILTCTMLDAFIRARYLVFCLTVHKVSLEIGKGFVNESFLNMLIVSDI